MRTQYDDGDIKRVIDKLATRLATAFPPDAPLSVIGIRTRGEGLACRLTDLLRKKGFTKVERGVLEKYHVTLIGAQIDAIKVAEDRLLFRNAMGEIGIEVPSSGVATGTAYSVSRSSTERRRNTLRMPRPMPASSTRSARARARASGLR